MNGLALCSGIGCLDLGLRIATRGSYRVVCHVEREAYAAATLVARMEDEALEPAPIWDDLKSFDGRPWRGVVDLITAGLPCQPYSAAGQRKGDDDERALWPEFVRIVREVEPAAIFLENVPAFLRFYGPVWSELSSMGFVHAPPLLRTASESGAIHLRRRLFVFAAHPDRANVWPECWRGECWPGPAEPGDDGLDAADADRNGFAVEWSGWVFDGERQTLRHDTDRCGPWCRTCPSPWATESPAVRVDHGPATRMVELRANGNGVVPVMAAQAWRELNGYVFSGDERNGR